MVDAVINHMATTHLTKDSECQGKDCRGFNGTIYSSRKFNGAGSSTQNKDDKSADVAVWTPLMFHHHPNNAKSNCGWPPYSNDRYLCDMYSLPDINTEMVESQTMILRYLFALFEIGVTHLRVDAASNIYSQSLNHIVNQIPWDYVVQEFYGNDLDKNQNALQVGHVTDFDYALFMAQGGKILDEWEDPNWLDTSSKFKELLDTNVNPMPRPKSSIDKGLLFLANHDLQRERWKPEQGGPQMFDYCTNPDDGVDGGNRCVLIYKFGQQYNLAQLFMLALPRGNNLRLMSSFAFFNFSAGPPLQTPSDLNNSYALPVGPYDYTRNGYPMRCKTTPEISPVNRSSWDWDTATPWVCEHRWDGVAGMVQFRKAIANYSQIEMRLNNQSGILGYSIDKVAFVALSRGYNWFTKHGPNETVDLANESKIWDRNSGMPKGEYCNMAAINHPNDMPTCGQIDEPWHRIKVDENGTIVSGHLPSGRIVAIHVAFKVSLNDKTVHSNPLAIGNDKVMEILV
jgi:alpha-amylase